MIHPLDWLHEILRRDPMVFLGDTGHSSECFWCEGIMGKHHDGCVYTTAVRFAEESLEKTMAEIRRIDGERK